MFVFKSGLDFLLLAICIMGFLSPHVTSAAQDPEWAQKFSPGTPPPEYVTERDYASYFSQQCRDIILPQWQAAPDAQSAVTQMNSLMAKINASFQSQVDIARGYAVYYYKTNRPVHSSLSNPSFSYLTRKNAGNVAYPELRDAALHYKQAYYFDASDLRINTMPDGLTQVMLPLYKTKGLKAFWETQELMTPPSFLPKIFQISEMGFPQEWEYKYSERRDYFIYQYYYKFPTLTVPRQLVPQHGIMSLRFDGRRTKDGHLEDVVLHDVICNITGEPEISNADGVGPRPPIIMQDCRAYKGWHACHVKRNGGPPPEQFCALYPKEEPVCGADE